jgi:hypothetical protein
VTTKPARRIDAPLRLVLAALVFGGLLAPGVASAYDRTTTAGGWSCVDAPRARGPMPASAVAQTGRARSASHSALTGQGVCSGVPALAADDSGGMSPSVAPRRHPVTAGLVRRRGPPSPTS